MARFYVDVFEFKEEEKALEDPNFYHESEYPNFYLTDGTVTLVLTPWKIDHYPEAEHRGPGFDHVGFKVENLAAFQKRFGNHGERGSCEFGAPGCEQYS